MQCTWPPSSQLATTLTLPHHSLRPCLTGAKGLIGVTAPYLVLNKPSLITGAGQAGGLPPFTSHVFKVLMQGFAGMQV